MCILHRQLEIFLPIRTLFGQGRVAKTRFDPMRVALRVNACYLHIIEVLVAAIDSRPSVPSAIGLASA